MIATAKRAKLVYNKLMKHLKILCSASSCAFALVLLAVPLSACGQSKEQANAPESAVAEHAPAVEAKPASIEPLPEPEAKAATKSAPALAEKTVAKVKQQPVAQAPKQAVAKPERKAEESQAKAEPAAEQVSVDSLKERLKNTKAIGVFTKLAIRNDIVDLVDEINRYRQQSKLQEKLQDLRSNFDGLLLKIIALLEEDPDLSEALYVGRESIWKSLLEVKA